MSSTDRPKGTNGLPLSLRSLGIPTAQIAGYLREMGDKPCLEIGVRDRHIIFGLGATNDASAPQITFGARVATGGRLPRPYLVIEAHPDGALTVLDSNTGQVRRWRSHDVDTVVAESYEEFKADLTRRVEAFEHGCSVLEAHVRNLDKRYGYDRRGQGGIPKDLDWRAYRSCVQDVIIGQTVLRYQPSGNCIEVDVFLTADVPELEEFAGTRTLVRLILGEAVRSGTNLEVRFTGNVEEGRIPEELRSLASQLDVSVGNVRPDSLSPSESSRLLLRLSGLSGSASERVAQLADAGEADLEQLSFAILEGSWSVHEMAVLLAAPDPRRILLGRTPPWDTIPYAEDRFVANAAVLAGRFLAKIARSSAIAEQRSLPNPNEPGAQGVDAWKLEETEDATVDLATDVDPVHMTLTVTATEDDRMLALEAPAIEDGVRWARGIDVLVRPLSGAMLTAQIERDLAFLRGRETDGPLRPPVLLVPGDFGSLAKNEQDRLMAELSSVGALVIVDQAKLVEVNEESLRRTTRLGVRIAS